MERDEGAQSEYYEALPNVSRHVTAMRGHCALLGAKDY
jgi:hypothetical protein